MPLEMDDAQSEQFTIRVPQSMKAKIDEYRKDEDRSMSAMIRRLLAEAIEAREAK